jgi:hypothetical protein
MRSLRQDGWRLVREGRTTVEEVLRVTKDEHVNVSLEAPAEGDGGASNGAAAGTGGAAGAGVSRGVSV